MIVNGQKINSIYVTREDNGDINLFGAHTEKGHVTAFASTKNMEGIGQKLYGEKYTNEYIVEKMKTRPTHNYIGQIGDPISYPCDPASVSFA